ncbi:hypothetical protein B6A27_18025 [Anoxybacillus sp. UARK-01]|jgi:ABC-2 type transport system ATP-binding protein|nr:hypothetical protein B6A27_18025 [Anoxybacillus sp. UARK-01]
MEGGVISKIGTMEQLREMYNRAIQLLIKVKKEHNFIANSLKHDAGDFISNVQTSGEYLCCDLLRGSRTFRSLFIICHVKISIYTK